MIRIMTLTMMTLLFSFAAAFAMPTTKAVVMDGSFDLSSIHTIAVCTPNYIPTIGGPDINTVTDQIAQSGYESKDIKGITVFPYSVISKQIKKETGVDLTTLSKDEAKKEFQKNIAKYADTYLVATIANDSRVVIFYDLYSAKDGKYLYSYEVIGGGQSDNNINSYKSFNNLFYKGLSDSIKDQHKNAEKTAKKK